MSSTDRTEQLRLGFLTAVETREHAYVGGLLVTDRFGRPLEFQCTTPVKPNRTQELLYGPTLVPFILGELLGKTLVERIAVKPHLVFVDRLEMLALRPSCQMPVLCSLERSKDDVPALEIVELGKHRWLLHAEFTSDKEVLKKHTSFFAADADMREPLERVAEALKETMAAVSPQVRVA